MRRWIAALTLPIALGGCASWKKFQYEGWGRDGWQQPDRVVAALAIEPGAQVADIGAGGGYFTFRLARAVGPGGLVYAVDIDPDMVGYLRERAREEKAENVVVVEATPSDPGLPAEGVDLLFTCNTYHHLDDPVAYFREARGTLRPGGRVAIIDLDGEGWFSWFFGHATSAEAMRREMDQAGYALVAEPTFLEQQNFMIFAPRDEARP